MTATIFFANLIWTWDPCQPAMGDKYIRHSAPICNPHRSCAPAKNGSLACESQYAVDLIDSDDDFENAEEFLKIHIPDTNHTLGLLRNHHIGLLPHFVAKQILRIEETKS